MKKYNKIGILGAARSGISAANKAYKLGKQVFLSDVKKYEDIDSLGLELGIEYEFGFHSDKILESDVIVLSPGIPNNIPIIRKAESLGIELISEIEFGFRIMNKKNKIIAVTGSNGKTTTVSLIKYVLDNFNKKCILAGNIGIPFTSYPIEDIIYDYIVLELSSFQLERIKEFKADYACLLNLTPDHLNRYNDFSEYADTKMNIFLNQNKNNVAVINYDDDEIKERIDKIKSEIYYFSLDGKNKGIYVKNNILFWNNKSYKLNNFKLKGPHNYMNIMTVCILLRKLNFKQDEIIDKIKNFVSLEHRLEFVKEINKVRFINDSKATNTDSVKYALQAFNNSTHIILGGSDKGEDFSILIPYLKNCKTMCLIGETKNKMNDCFKIYKDKIIKSNTLKEAVITLFELSKENDIILLSPACASFDMFNNYEDRGIQFKRIVEEINL